MDVAKLYTDDAELYDIAFDWDVGGEVEWLLERLGPGCGSVFEPGCGSGRMLDAFAHCSDGASRFWRARVPARSLKRATT